MYKGVKILVIVCPGNEIYFREELVMKVFTLNI